MADKEVPHEETTEAAVSKIDALLDRKPSRPTEELPPPSERQRLRQAAELTQAEVADALSVSVASVSAWEKGRWDPKGKARADYLYLLRKLREREESTTDD